MHIFIFSSKYCGEGLLVSKKQESVYGLWVGSPTQFDVYDANEKFSQCKFQHRWPKDAFLTCYLNLLTLIITISFVYCLGVFELFFFNCLIKKNNQNYKYFS